MIDVCILWGWCLNVFWTRLCILYRGAYHVIFVINVVTSTSMQTRLRVNADFSSCCAVIFMPCKHVATERSMHYLRYFSKGVLTTWLCSIHPWSWLQFWSSLACPFCALLLLQIVSSQIVYKLFNFAGVVVVVPDMLWCCFLPCIASMSCLLDGCMLSLSLSAL